MYLKAAKLFEANLFRNRQWSSAKMAKTSNFIHLLTVNAGHKRLCSNYSLAPFSSNLQTVKIV